MNEVIKKVGNKWVLFHANGKGRLGTHDTKAQAIAQEVAIKIAKKKREEDESVWAGWERVTPRANSLLPRIEELEGDEMRRADRHKKTHDIVADPYPVKPESREHLDPHVHMDCLPTPEVKVTIPKATRARSRGK